MNILITGANGFIGQHLSSYLSDKGHYLYLLTRKVPLDRSSCFKYISVDLSVCGFSKILPSDIDIVIHLAQSMRYRDFPQGSADMISVNVNATVELLEWCRAEGVKRFIYTSTANVYSPSTEILTEKSLANPSSFYGASKLAAEICIKQYQEFFHIDILRCFTVYGPRQKNMLIANLIERVKNGSPIILAQGVGIFLTPIFVDDVSFAINKLLKIPCSKKSNIFNICGDQIVSLSEVVTFIEGCLEKKAVLEITDRSPSSFTGSNEKVKSALELPKCAPLKKGIELSIANKLYSEDYEPV